MLTSGVWFFVEVEFDTGSANVVELRIFTSLGQLQEYEAYIQLPEWLG